MAILEYDSQVIEAAAIAAVGEPGWDDDRAGAALAEWMSARVGIEAVN